MTTTVKFNDFKSPALWRNRYRRAEFQLWDANLHHGDVRPFACPEIICNSLPGLLYPITGCPCGQLPDAVSAVKGFCVDAHYYVNTSGHLRIVSESDICSNSNLDGFQAGAPIPNQLTGAGSQNCDEGCDVYRLAYVLTYVVDQGGVLIESSPSTPVYTAGVNNPPNTILTWATATAAQQEHNIVSTRLYRTETSFEDGTDGVPVDNSEYVLVGDFPGFTGRTDWVDTMSSSQTGGPLTTYEPTNYPAPFGTLVAVARTSDGIAVAERNRVYISMPGQPQFTWDGVVEIEDDIIDIVALNNTIFVLTNNRPVKIAYAHTDGAMSIDRQVIERRLPLTSRESVSIYDGRVYFASTHSLYSWDIGGYGSDISSVLTNLMTPEQWSNVDPSTVAGTAYEFGYVFSSSRVNYSFMVEFGGDRTDTANGTSIIPISYIDADQFALSSEGHIIYRASNGVFHWDWRRSVNDNPLEIYDHLRPPLQDQCDCCDWKIVMYFDNEGKNRFSKMRVEWDERSATHLNAKFTLKAFGNEDTLVDDLEIISSRGFSIPKFCSAQTFCVEVSGCGIMHEIRLATSMQELVSNSNNLIGNPGEGNG